MPGAVEEANDFFKQKPAVEPVFQKVVDLIDGFESPFGLELLATVHWVVSYENAKTMDEVVTNVHAWNDHKKEFSVRQIGIAYDTLNKNGWFGQI